MTQPTEGMPQAAGEGDPWAAWGWTAGQDGGPAGEDGAPSGLRRAGFVLLPLAVLALLAVGVVLYLFTGDPASAAGSCGGG